MCSWKLSIRFRFDLVLLSFGMGKFLGVGMSSGGMGDTLTGIIAGLLAQGLPPLASAALGACLHGDAADLVAAEFGERGMLASDLLPHVRRLVNRMS